MERINRWVSGIIDLEGLPTVRDTIEGWEFRHLAARTS